MKSGKIAVLGDKDSVLAFKAVGADAFHAGNAFEANDVLRRIKDEYTVIFITEDLASKIEDTLGKLKSRAYPIVIPIPGQNGSDGFGMKGVRSDVEKAVGADILFND
ncbi:MAG: V-type ATP synthase subunit F [Clostridiales bacterium]|nr:V-type ATP synthase subunit F [Clostridiales bacterium]